MPRFLNDKNNEAVKNVIVVLIMILIIFIGMILIILNIGIEQQEEDRQEELDDKTIILEGFIEAMKIDVAISNDYIIVVNNKEYSIGHLINDYLNEDEDIYYWLNVGDYITVYKSGRILINGTELEY